MCFKWKQAESLFSMNDYGWVAELRERQRLGHRNPKNGSYVHNLIAAEFQYIKTEWRNIRTWRGGEKTRNNLKKLYWQHVTEVRSGETPFANLDDIFRKNIFRHFRPIRKEKLQDKPISFAMSVRPSLWLSACNNSGILKGISWSVIFRTIRRIIFKFGKNIYSASQVQFAHILSAGTMTDVAQLRIYL